MPLTLANMPEVPFADGVYRIIDMENNTIIYIGESQDLRIRLTIHCRGAWKISKPYFSVTQLVGMESVHRKRETETDLLGGDYSRNKKPSCLSILREPVQDNLFNTSPL